MTIDLISTLERAGEQVDQWVAVLWTWLMPQLSSLDSRERNLRSIRARDRELPAELPDLGKALEALRRTSDLPGEAARLLVALDRWAAGSGRAETLFSGPVAGVDGEHYYVTSWQPWLARKFWEHSQRDCDAPPVADYAPSIHTLARQLLVVPAVVNGIALESVEAVQDAARQRALHRVRQRLGRVAACLEADGEQPPRFAIHLAALGPNSLDGLKPDVRRGVFAYADPTDGRTSAAIEASMSAAIDAAAAAEASVLVFPELAIPVGSLGALKELLARASLAPALTVASLRHSNVAQSGERSQDEGGAALAHWANEAVVLGDRGEELFRHRKLTSFAFPYEGTELQEDTRLGDRLPILRSAIGNVAVMICLDAFSGAADRLRDSHASLVLVPSLSPSVSPHRVALADAVRLLWGAAFVCNRAPAADGSDGWLPERVRSFWSIALLNGCRPARQLSRNAPTFVFDLAHEAQRQDGRAQPADERDSSSIKY